MNRNELFCHYAILCALQLDGLESDREVDDGTEHTTLIPCYVMVEDSVTIGIVELGSAGQLGILNRCYKDVICVLVLFDGVMLVCQPIAIELKDL